MGVVVVCSLFYGLKSKLSSLTSCLKHFIVQTNLSLHIFDQLKMF